MTGNCKNCGHLCDSLLSGKTVCELEVDGTWIRNRPPYGCPNCKQIIAENNSEGLAIIISASCGKSMSLDDVARYQDWWERYWVALDCSRLSQGRWSQVHGPYMKKADDEWFEFLVEIEKTVYCGKVA